MKTIERRNKMKTNKLITQESLKVLASKLQLPTRWCKVYKEDLTFWENLKRKVKYWIKLQNPPILEHRPPFDFPLVQIVKVRIPKRYATWNESEEEK
jgi:hypothetical protein